MSSGSMNYLYMHVQGADFRLDTPLRRAFRSHLMKVSKALRSIEWNDSDDGDDHEEENIRACLSDGDSLRQAIEDAEKVMGELRREIEAAKGQKK